MLFRYDEQYNLKVGETLIEIIEALKNNHIIDRQNVKTIKEYIQHKYPDAPADRSASIFADAIHKIIDDNIIHFDETSRSSIKKTLFKEVSQKKELEINAFEVFEVCTQLYDANEDYIEHLTSWINHNQNQILSINEVTQLTTETKKSVDEVSFGTIETQTSNSQTTQLNDEIKISVDTSTSEMPQLKTAAQVLKSRLAELDEDPHFYYIKQAVAKKPAYQIPEKDIQPFYSGIRRPKHIPYTKMSLFHRFKNRYKEIFATILIFTGLLTIINSLEYFDHGKSSANSQLNIDMSLIMNTFNEQPNEQPIELNHLPESLQYKAVNLEALKKWLVEKNSVLAEETYFNSINNTAKAYGINPLLMFAIIGQEQGFVPKTNADATAIANNPFNVFGSWEKYNTNIDDSSKIAATTILNLSKDCPENEDPIKWINRKYAEDETWHIGVTKIFSQLEKATTINE